MNNITMGVLMLIGSATAVYTDMPEEIMKIFDDSIEAAMQVCTAGDLHSMSVILDANYIMDRKLPAENEFKSWLNDAFKENNVKDLADDHWGNPYVYKRSQTGRSYMLVSAGTDGLLGTDDDMIKTGP